MKRALFLLTVILTMTACHKGQDDRSRLLLLGDIHYDLLENHDLGWLATTKDDLRQVTTEYSVFTAKFWDRFSERLVQKTKSAPFSAVLQMGDISEGLAGTPELARQMAHSVFAAVDSIGFEVPVIIAKGNHDITGPGAREAFDEIYLPNMARLSGHERLESANYSTEIGDMLFVCFDPWEESDNKHKLDRLEQLLSASDARYKFVMVHEPVIPINERCWHLFRRTPEQRERLLHIIAEHRAIVLCAHMHLYSLVRRDTPEGPILQVMVNSVVRDSTLLQPRNVITQYGESLALNNPSWEPETLEQRCAWLKEETPHIKYFKQADLPGYGVLTIDPRTDNLTLEYYAAFGEEPYDVVNLSAILNQE